MRAFGNMSLKLDLGQVALVTRRKLAAKVAPKVETTHVT